MNETTLKIKMNADGNGYTIDIVESDAKSGSRLDQKVAQSIVEMDKKLKSPEFMQQLEMAKRQMGGMMPQPGMGNAMRGMMNPFMGF